MYYYIIYSRGLQDKNAHLFCVHKKILKLNIIIHCEILND